MAIRRIWRGYTTTEEADEYRRRLLDEIIPEIEGMHLPGYRGIEVLRRESGEDEVEFTTLMTFDSLEGLIAFRGADYARSHVPERAREVLARWDEFASHHDILRS
ncbi:MAG: antibiotic biosynthesis monooxygenase [Acidobacteriota bacterium]